MCAAQGYERISHGIGPERPFRLKFDTWDRVGPGRRDMHYEVELGIVCRGRMRRDFAGISRYVESGELWFHGIWEPHAAEVLQAPLELVMLHIDPAALAAQNFREAPDIQWLSPFIVPPEERPFGRLLPDRILQTHIRVLRKLGDGDAPSDRLRLRLAATNLLLDFFAHWNAKSTGAVTHGGALPRLEQILQDVFAGAEWLSASEAASKYGMSRNGFALFFRQHMGISYSDFTLRHRLSEAAGELLAGDKPVKAIALDWGFCNLSHFYRRFSVVYGCTPLEYRERRNSDAFLKIMPKLPPEY